MQRFNSAIDYIFNKNAVRNSVFKKNLTFSVKTEDLVFLIHFKI